MIKNTLGLLLLLVASLGLISGAGAADEGRYGKQKVVYHINYDNPMLSDQQRDLICTAAGFSGSETVNVLPSP